jgi:dihydrofolate synthase/folylpolyglutamate synthase
VTYQEAVEYIGSFINYEREASWQYPEAFKLDRMRLLAKQFGNPQNAYESVIIAGSKGKGSTAAILASILRMENLRVGLYTSPHLLDIRERIQVNGLCVNETRFIEYCLMLRQTLNKMDWKKDPPTYFEVLTVIAFHHFREMKIQVAVLEVGLGGLYDSTNIVEARVAGITPISMEHTDKLGKTLQKIAVQKCGIIRERQIVVSGIQEPEAEAVIRKTAEDRGARLIRVGREIKTGERDFDERCQFFDCQTPFGNYFNLRMELLGAHQIANAAQAVGLAKALEEKTRLTISENAVRQGVLDARWPGRLEKIGEKPLIILDGAQNQDSARKLVSALKRHYHFDKLILVLGISQDKDVYGILSEILPHTFLMVATQTRNPRALSAAVLAEAARTYTKKILTETDTRSALDRALSAAGPEDVVLVTGSLFLVGEIKEIC